MGFGQRLSLHSKRSSHMYLQLFKAIMSTEISVYGSHVGEKLIAQREFDNQFNKYAINLLNGDETVGQLSYHAKYSRIYDMV